MVAAQAGCDDEEIVRLLDEGLEHLRQGAFAALAGHEFRELDIGLFGPVEDGLQCFFVPLLPVLDITGVDNLNDLF